MEKEKFDTPEKRALVEKLLIVVLGANGSNEYMKSVYDNEEVYFDEFPIILSNAMWWFSGGETLIFYNKIAIELHYQRTVVKITPVTFDKAECSQIEYSFNDEEAKLFLSQLVAF